MGDVMLGKQDSGFVDADSLLDRILHPEFVEQPGPHALDEHRVRAREPRNRCFHEAFEL